MAVLTITEENFTAEVLNADKPVLVDFFASWCGPCRMVSPIVDALAAENPGIKFGKIDIDAQPALAAKYGVMSIPTLIVFKNGEIASKAVGAQPRAEIQKMLE